MSQSDSESYHLDDVHEQGIQRQLTEFTIAILDLKLADSAWTVEGEGDAITEHRTAHLYDPDTRSFTLLEERRSADHPEDDSLRSVRAVEMYEERGIDRTDRIFLEADRVAGSVDHHLDIEPTQESFDGWKRAMLRAVLVDSRDFYNALEIFQPPEGMVSEQLSRRERSRARKSNDAMRRAALGSLAAAVALARREETEQGIR
jgi:hypothetical protein